MREPAASTLPHAERLHVLPLDVTDAASISAAVDQAGHIDVLVNNAGIGWFNALEGTSLATAREVFEANFFGVIAMMHSVLPAMRERRAGTIVNVSSSTIYAPLPMLAVYRASKAAVTAMTEAAAGELAPFNVKARVVVPGLAPTTGFASNVQGRVAERGWFPPAYSAFAQEVLAEQRAHPPEQLTKASDVAEAIFRAATDPDCPAVLPAGADAVEWAARH